MEDAPKYHGIEIDAETALALLQWQAELGADEAVLDSPLDRLDVVPAARAAPAPLPPQPVLSQQPVLSAPAGDQDMLAEARGLAGRAATLDELSGLQEGFDGIDLKKGARNFVFADGNPAARLMIVGEAPGEEEDRLGRPFVGRAGQLLDLMLGAIGLARDSVDAERAVYIANVLKWRPPGNRRPTPEEIAMSLPFLERQVALVEPELIILMGNTPCLAALNREGILRLRGTWVEAFGRPALPMTHPAYLLRNPIAKREAWADLLQVAARMGV